MPIRKVQKVEVDKFPISIVEQLKKGFHTCSLSYYKYKHYAIVSSVLENNHNTKLYGDFTDDDFNPTDTFEKKLAKWQLVLIVNTKSGEYAFIKNDQTDPCELVMIVSQIVYGCFYMQDEDITIEEFNKDIIY